MTTELRQAVEQAEKAMQAAYDKMVALERDPYSAYFEIKKARTEWRESIWQLHLRRQALKASA